jgi:hypothetical protein
MAKRRYYRAIEEEYVDWVFFIGNPLKGEKAVKLAKKGLLLSKLSPWLAAILLILINWLDYLK